MQILACPGTILFYFSVIYKVFSRTGKPVRAFSSVNPH